MLHEGKSIIMVDTLEEDASERSVSMEVLRIRSVMCIPLMIHDRISGVIYVDSIENPYGFREEDLGLLTALGNSATAAIETLKRPPY